ncbi:O-linked N-acetylglucosamine transferase, SPINDLY family protein [Azospirillum canadense]|uniref:O-linked N-acetylglucosamine transferase, SPINDLY family protein n=1 Tax=Azospirillum canadense TaxID=403962 RepID=UPI002227756F|nr:tetratricopeptide repeat protein [Azospirillum canadense]MCW2243329.1 putative O-linked N-acetylglucosamine transferase (SPINDLY family) [Azospirillum canadense]
MPTDLPSRDGARIEEARRMLAASPGDGGRLEALFAALDALGEPGTPDEAVARSNHGEALRRQGRVAEALAHHHRALAWLPGFGGVHFNLGLTLQALGRLSEAVDAYGEAARLMPDLAAALCNQGVLLRALGQLEAADVALRDALARDRALMPAWLNLGAVLQAAGRSDRVAACFRNALALRPDLAEAHANLGIALKEAGRIAESVPALERALALGLPDAGGVLAQLVQQQRHLCRWGGLAERSARLVAAVRDGATQQAHPWIFLGEGAGPALERRCAERYSAWRTRTAPATRFQHGRGARDRLRVGYLSADFQEHATAALIAELIERHDRRRVEVIGYSYGPDDGGPMRRRLAGAFDRFVDLSTVPHAEAAARIHDDGVDILVDLKGHTQGARIEIPAQRPAPVQVQWLGYPGTTGAPCFDYVIGDPIVTPFDRQAGYSERIVQLPACYQPNDRRRVIGATPTPAACGLPERGFVFCCFNAPYKITPALFDLWCRLLMAVPGSVLWLLEGAPEVSDNLRREAACRGPAPERLVFAPRLPPADHLARYRLADLFLDTTPVGAHTTASDALWAGLPVLTVPGDGFAARVGASLLRAVGLPDLAVPDLDAYEAVAIRLASQPGELADLKARLTAGRDRAPLFDTDRMARSLERAFATMWAIHVAGEAPRSFAAPED